MGNGPLSSQGGVRQAVRLRQRQEAQHQKPRAERGIWACLGGASPALSGKGLGLVRLLFHSFFSSRPCRKKRCVRPSPLRVQVSWHDLRAGSAAPQGPPGGRAREGLGLTGSPGSRADALRRAVCGHAVLGLQAWLLPAAHRLVGATSVSESPCLGQSSSVCPPKPQSFQELNLKPLRHELSQ